MGLRPTHRYENQIESNVYDQAAWNGKDRGNSGLGEAV